MNGRTSQRIGEDMVMKEESGSALVHAFLLASKVLLAGASIVAFCLWLLPAVGLMRLSWDTDPSVILAMTGLLVALLAYVDSVQYGRIMVDLAKTLHVVDDNTADLRDTNNQIAAKMRELQEAQAEKKDISKIIEEIRALGNKADSKTQHISKTLTAAYRIVGKVTARRYDGKGNLIETRESD